MSDTTSQTSKIAPSFLTEQVWKWAELQTSLWIRNEEWKSLRKEMKEYQDKITDYMVNNKKSLIRTKYGYNIELEELESKWAIKEKDVEYTLKNSNLNEDNVEAI